MVLICVGLSLFVTGGLAFAFVRDPYKGMRQATHRLEQLPRVMAGRYVFFAFLSIGALLSRDMKTIAWLFTAYMFVSFFDAWIYRREGFPHIIHTAAGVGSGVIAVLASVAAVKHGAA